jgi:hypothetical protein
MADQSVFGVLVQMIMTLGGQAFSTFKSLTGLFKELLAAMGGVFGVGGLSAYLGAFIVFVVAILVVKFFIAESKLILALVGIVLMIFLLAVVV